MSSNQASDTPSAQDQAAKFTAKQHTDFDGRHFWVKPILDVQTSTFSYVVSDESGVCAVIDPVLGFDLNTGRTNTEQADQIIGYIEQNQLSVQWILETHAHADHLSSAAYLQGLKGGQVAISEKILEVQQIFKHQFNIAHQFEHTHYFDCLLKEGTPFMLGSLQVEMIPVPGHTPADAAFVIADAVFVGDTLFEPDLGTARCDFAGGSAKQLYASIQRLLQLPPQSCIYVCHDYPKQREYRCCSTVADHLTSNVHVRQGISEAEFVQVRQARDRTLGLPSLILPSVQVNIRAGQLLPKVGKGSSTQKAEQGSSDSSLSTGYITIPIDRF